MANVLVQSQKDAESIEKLLKKKIPAYRQAYSDRTAWVMACMSEIAYIKFNPSILTDKRKEFIHKNIIRSLKKKRKTDLLKYISLLEYDHKEEYKKLEKEVAILGMEIIETFDCSDTQAVLVSYGNHIVLAFRGTESTSINDIKSDVKAKIMQCETGGKIHTGFKEAFDEVIYEIGEKLKVPELKEKSLFITGHSLGGALATVAAKKLSHAGGIAACYTFGSPRVGNDDWIEDIKTPIYRVVNAADCVTMLPPGGEFISGFAWLLRTVSKVQIPFISSALEWMGRWLLLYFDGYTHCGNMRFLTDCPKGNYSNVKLLYSVSFWRRVKGYGIKKLGRSFLADHSITVYRKKLMIVAERRNP